MPSPQPQRDDMMSNKSIYAKRVDRGVPPPSVPFDMEPEEVVSAPRPADHYDSVGAQVAQSGYFKRNFMIQDLKDAFPGQYRMWSVSKSFPYAHDGLLLVDEPTNKHELAMSKEKAVVLKKAGFKFIIIEKGTSVEDALMELENL
jgi:hypothetical protein